MVQAKSNTSQNVRFSSGQYSGEFLDETVRVWQTECSDRKLTCEDAREIAVNMTGFFQVLIEWDRSETAVVENAISSSE